MAEYISFQPSDFFSTTAFTGTGSALSVTGVGFQPDMSWFKYRAGADNHGLNDAVRGSTVAIYPNLSVVQGAVAQSVTSFDADGFSLGTDSTWNTSGNMISWNWKMGTTTGIAGSPSITPSAYSFSATAGQSIIQWTGTGANGTLPHGLGVAPTFIMVKNLTQATQMWNTYHEAAGNTVRLYLNLNSIMNSATSAWNDTSPDANLFTVGTNDETNMSAKTMIAYCFAPVKGYSYFDMFTGNGNGNGQMVHTGFRPAFILIKRTSYGTSNWMLYDSKRLGYNEENAYLETSSTQEEYLTVDIDILSNGFKLRDTAASVGSAGNSYVFMAFAEFPTVSSNNVAGVAR